MLNAEQKKIIAGLLKISEADFTAALDSAEEVSLTIPTSLTTVTDEDLNRIKNTEYKSGKEKGLEMAVKESKEKLGLDFQGKTIDGPIEAAQKKALADAKLSPDERVSKLEADLNILRTTNETLTGQLTQKEKEALRAKTDRELFKHIPSFGENGPALGPDDFLALARGNGYDFKLEEGQLVAYKGDQPLKDATAKALPVADVLKQFATEKKLIQEDGGQGGARGRGGADNKKGAAFTKLSELKAHYQEQGKSLNGQEFMDHAAKLKAENADFDLSA